MLLLCTSIAVKAQIGLTIDGTDTLKISKLVNAGRKFELSSNGKELLKIGEQLEKAGRVSNSHIGLLYASLYRSDANWMFSNYPECMKYALEGLSRSKQWEVKAFLPALYGNIGTVYKENLDYPKALDAAEKALNAAKDVKDTSEIIICSRVQAMFTHGDAFHKDTTSAIGRALRVKSLELHLAGLKIAESNSKYEITRTGFYNNIAQYYLEAKDYKKTLAYGLKAITLINKYSQYKSATYTYTWLGRAYFEQGDQAKGLSYLQTAIALCKKYKFPFREMEIYSSLEECYVKTGDYKSAWKAKSRWITIKDSLNIIKNVSHLNDLDVKYQTSEKNAQIKLLDESAKHKNNLFLLAGAALVILLIFTFELYHQKRQITRTNQSLLESNKTIHSQALKLEVLLKELHHRVKNNLQIVTSLLNLQLNRLTDQDAIHAIRDSQQRIEAMSLIHRTLYQQENSSLVNMRQFITDLVTSIMHSFGVKKAETDLKLTIDVEEMDIEIALPLGLIINELVINAFKHAFVKDKQLILTVDLLCKNDCELTVKDNGPGMPTEVWDNPQNSFGVKLVKLLTKQLGGSCTMDNKNGASFKFIIASKVISK